MKKVYFIPLALLAIFLVLTLVTATFYPEPFTGNLDINDYNITNANYIIANYFDGIFTGNVTGEVTGAMNWTKLQNYPVACAGSSAVTTLDDSVTCSDLWVDEAGDTMTGNLTFSNSGILNISLIESLDWTNVTVTENQISDLQIYLINNTAGWTLNFSNIFSSDWTNVTVTESQISDLQDYLINETSASMTDIYASNFNGLPTYCYQETANVSTACGGLATGSYSFTGDWYGLTAGECPHVNCYLNAIDGTWTDMSSPLPYPTYPDQPASLYINYSRVGSSKPLWRVGWYYSGSFETNITIPDSCFNDPVQLLINATFRDDVNDTAVHYCKNSSGDWQELLSSEFYQISEEGMYWNSPVGSASLTNITISNTADIENLQAANLEENMDGTGYNITASWFKGVNFNATGDLTLGQRITFALGELIDNIVDGWIRITGNLNVTGDVSVDGNVTAENVYLPTYLTTHTNASITAVAGTWLNVTFAAHDDTENARITHTYNDATNDTFIIVDTGVYRLSYGISFIDSAASPGAHIAIRIINNGTEIEGSVFEKDSTKQNAVGTIYRSAMASLLAGDYIKLQFVSNATTVSMYSEETYGDHPTSANINIHRI